MAKRHVVQAWEAMPLNDKHNKFFIEIANSKDVKGVVPVVSFKVQSDPIKEVGVNGCQAQDMLEYVKYLFLSLNAAFPCEENYETIAHIDKALDAQNRRTANRIARGVEGLNEI